MHKDVIAPSIKATRILIFACQDVEHGGGNPGCCPSKLKRIGWRDDRDAPPPSLVSRVGSVQGTALTRGLGLTHLGRGKG